jgi:hypothetical protein
MSRPGIIDEQLDVLDALDSSHHSGGAQGNESNAPLLIQKWSEVGALNLPVGEQIIHELERGELAMLAAVTNVGKSTLLRNLALSLACGRGYPPIVRGGQARRVLLLDFETRLSRFQRDIKKMLENLSPDERALVADNFALACDMTFNDEPLTLSDEQHLGWLAMNARDFKADLIIVDTVTAAFALREENSNAEVAAKILKPLVRMARETNASVLISHHIGKGGSEERKATERAYRARGASAFGAFASLVINLTQSVSDPNRVTLTLAKSKGERFDDVNLQLDREARWFSVGGKPVNASPTSYDLVLRLFEDGRARRCKEVKAALSGMVAERTVAQSLADAVQRMELEMPKRGVYQKPRQNVQNVQPLIGDT